MTSARIDSFSLLGKSLAEPSQIASADQEALSRALVPIVQKISPGANQEVSFAYRIVKKKGLQIQFNGTGKWHTVCTLKELVSHPEYQPFWTALCKVRQSFKEKKPQFAENYPLQEEVLDRRLQILAQPMGLPGGDQLGPPIDVNSFFRNLANVLVAVKDASNPIARAAAIMTIGIFVSELAGGGMAVYSGLNAFGKSGRKMMLALENRDYEGVLQEFNMALGGGSYAVLGGGMVLESAAALAGSPAASLVGGVIGSSAGIVMAAALLAYAAKGLQMSHRFRQEFHSILGEKREPEKVFAAVKWIQDQLTLTPTEELEILASSDTPQIAQEKVHQALNRKWNAFERRTSASCCKNVREKLPELKNLMDTDPAKALTLAQEIVEEVDRESYRMQVTYQLFMIIGLFMLVGSILGLIVASGPLAPALCFCIGALLWLTVDSETINRKITLTFWDMHKKFSQNPVPLELPAPA